MIVKSSKFKVQSLKILILIVIFHFSLFTFHLSEANADSISLGIDPPIFQINTTPPANILAPLTIENRSDISLSLKVSFKSFVPTDREDGQIKYVNQDLGLDIKLLDSAGNSVDELSLSPKQVKPLTLSINIPREFSQGDHYFSIIFLSSKVSKEEETSSESVAGIASNVLLSIGAGRPTGEISEFSTPFFAEKGPVPFTVRIKNTGNHFVTPKGEILIRNLFGQTIGRVDLAQVNVLANSVRSIPSQDFLEENDNFPEELAAYWPQNFILGPYRASLSMSLSDTGPLFKRDIYFFAFPIKGLIAVAIGVLILTYITMKVRSKI